MHQSWKFLEFPKEMTGCLLFFVWNPSLCSPFLDCVQTNMSNISSAFILNFCTINNCTKVSADLVCYSCRIALHFCFTRKVHKLNMVDRIKF